MPTKTISIMDDVYEELVRLKRPEESFSEELRRLARNRGKISECAGLWARWMKPEDLEEIETAIERRRQSNRKSREEKMRGL